MISTSLCGKKKCQNFNASRQSRSDLHHLIIFQRTKKQRINSRFSYLGGGIFFHPPFAGSAFDQNIYPCSKKPSFHPERRGGWKNFTLSKNSFELDARSRKKPKTSLLLYINSYSFSLFFCYFQMIWPSYKEKRKKTRQNFDDHRDRIRDFFRNKTSQHSTHPR